MVKKSGGMILLISALALCMVFFQMIAASADQAVTNLDLGASSDSLETQVESLSVYKKGARAAHGAALRKSLKRAPAVGPVVNSYTMTDSTRGQSPKQQPENSSGLISRFPVQTPGNTALIIQDQNPWGYDSIQQILNANGVSYDQVDSSQISTIDLSPYELVIIPSVQPDGFYTTWNAHIAKFEAYVQAGGALWLSTCNQGGQPEPLVPGGVISATDFDSYNDIIEPSHPWVAGVPDPMWGSAASHDSFTNLYPGSLVVAQAQTSGNPTLVDYRMDAGRVLITGQTLEYAWYLGWDGAPILENSLLDMRKGILEGTVSFVGLDCQPGQGGQIPPCSGPYPDYEITVYKADGVTVETVTRSDPNGDYWVTLNPGDYIVHTPSGPVRTITHPVTTATGRTTTLDLVIDTGMR